MIPCDRHPYAPSQMYMCYILYIIFFILIIMSEKEEEVREVEVAEKKPTLERRGANSEIILVELKSVADTTSPVKAEDVKKIGKQIINMFPNGIQLENLIEATMIILKEVTKIYKLKAQHKIDLIVDILLYVIDNTDAGSLEVFDPILKKMIPGVIDNLLKVDEGKLVLHNKTLKERLLCCLK